MPLPPACEVIVYAGQGGQLTVQCNMAPATPTSHTPLNAFPPIGYDSHNEGGQLTEQWNTPLTQECDKVPTTLTFYAFAHTSRALPL